MSEPQRYRVQVDLAPGTETEGELNFRCGERACTLPVPRAHGLDTLAFDVDLDAGDQRLEAFVEADGRRRGIRRA